MTYTSFKDAREGGNDFVEEESPASRLAAIGVPVLAIVGAEDQILDVEDVIAGFQTVPGARVEELDGVGHSPNIEDPEGTAELILPFVAAGEEFTPPPAPAEPGTKPKPTPKGSGMGPKRP